MPAPLDELPLLARAGALLPLLPPDVDTLASYGTRGRLVGLRERGQRLELIAFPRGRSSARFGDDGVLRSIEGRRSWTLRVAARRKRRIRVQASLATLRRPFAPVAVTVGGRRLPRSRWRYGDSVLTLSLSARRATVSVLG